jgi:hypothetical protein
VIAPERVGPGVEDDPGRGLVPLPGPARGERRERGPVQRSQAATFMATISGLGTRLR